MASMLPTNPDVELLREKASKEAKGIKSDEKALYKEILKLRDRV